MRQIRTKYEGVCRHCRRRVGIGETVYWEQGKGIWHLNCDSKPSAITVPTSKFGMSRRNQVTVVLIVIIAISALIAVGPYLGRWITPPSQKPSQLAFSSQQSSASPTSVRLSSSSASTTGQKPKWISSDSNVVSWSQAGSYIGQSKTVEGTVVRSFTSKGTIFLDFHDPYQGYFFGVIFSSDTANFHFNPASFYLNKEVRITGTIQLYQGAPEIIVHSPSQIEVAYVGFNYP